MANPGGQGTGIGSDIFGGIGAIFGAAGSDKLTNVYYSPQVRDILEKRLDVFDKDLPYYDKALSDFDVGNQQRKTALEKIGRENLARYGQLGSLATSSEYDPRNTYSSVLNQNFGQLSKFYDDLTEQGRKQRSLAQARLGQGGVRGGSFIDVAMPAAYAPTLANAYMGTLQSVLPAAQAIHSGRLTNLGVAGDFASRLPETVNYASGMELLPAYARQEIRHGDLGVLRDASSAWRENIAGMKQKQNWADRVNTGFQGLGQVADGVIRAYMAAQTGGLSEGIGGGMGGGGKGGGGGGSGSGGGGGYGAYAPSIVINSPGASGSSGYGTGGSTGQGGMQSWPGLWGATKGFFTGYGSQGPAPTGGGGNRYSVDVGPYGGGSNIYGEPSGIGGLYGD